MRDACTSPTPALVRRGIPEGKIPEDLKGGDTAAEPQVTWTTGLAQENHAPLTLRPDQTAASGENHRKWSHYGGYDPRV